VEAVARKSSSRGRVRSAVVVAPAVVALVAIAWATSVGAAESAAFG
jgi:hypothetical protein